MPDAVSDTTEVVMARQQGAVLTLTLNRPDALNAVDDAMGAALLKALKAVRKDDSVRCLILTGAGRAFCSGQDLKSRSIQAGDGGVPHLGDSIRTRYAPIISLLHQLEKPVIACVNGTAAGAGASLAFACDLRIAAPSAKFIQAFVKVGLIPDSGACWMLPRLAGFGRAMQLALTGEAVSASQALAWGLVNTVSERDETAMAETEVLAVQLAAGPPRAMALIKRAMRQAMRCDLDAYLACEADLQEIAGRTEDYREGVRAFMEKRPPVFTGR